MQDKGIATTGKYRKRKSRRAAMIFKSWLESKNVQSEHGNEHVVGYGIL